LPQEVLVEQEEVSLDALEKPEPKAQDSIIVSEKRPLKASLGDMIKFKQKKK